MPTNLTDLSNLHEHPIYQLGDRIQEICAPLFNNFPINYFLYARHYHSDRQVIALDVVSSRRWLKWYVQSNHPFLGCGKRMHSWLSTMPQEAQVEAATNFGHYNGIVLEKAHSDYIEVLEFASPNLYDTPLEFCNNKDLLNQFLVYFKEKASNIIKVLEREPLCLPKSRFLKLEDPDKPYTDFCQAIKTKSLSFEFQAKEVSFTRREFEVMSLLIKGKNMREVATILRISPRTVETYLYNAKNKINVLTVSSLLDHFAKSLF